MNASLHGFSSLKWEKSLFLGCNVLFTLGLVVLFLSSAFLRDVSIPGGNLAAWRHAATSTLDANNQFLWFSNLIAYNLLFFRSNLVTFFPYHLNFSRIFRPEALDKIWITALLSMSLAFFVSIRYCMDYKEAAANTDTVVLLCGILFFQGAVRWSIQSTDLNYLRRSVLNVLVFVGCACLLLSPLGKASEYFYHGYLRWIGIYANPNEFGVIMSVIFLISFSRLLDKIKDMELMGVSLFVVTASIAGLCLLKSYSREAWITALFGSLVLLWNTGRTNYTTAAITSDNTLLREKPCRTKFPYLLLSVGMIIGLGISYGIVYSVSSKVTIMQRAFSPFNPADFSSRNRLASFQDGISMLLDRPISGYGWKDLIDLHNSLYLQQGLSDGQALKLNDFLVMALRFGIPTLTVFLLLVWFCLSKGTKQLSQPRFDDKQLCKIMALVLLIAFNFSDGLCRFATGNLLWLFLAFSLDVEAAICQRNSQLNAPSN